MIARVFSVQDLAAPYRDTWSHLCASRHECGVAFLTPEYVETVAKWRPYVFVCVFFDDGVPVAFFPFQFRSWAHKWLRAAERVGEELSDSFGIVASDFTVAPEELLTAARLHHIYFSHLDETQHIHGLSGDCADTAHQIDLSSGAAEYWRSIEERDRRFVRDTARRQRRCEERFGELTLSIVDTQDRRSLTALIEHKRAQYQRTRVPDALAEPWKRRVLEDLFSLSSPSLRGMLHVLMAGKTWVASHFGLLSQGILHYWFPVYNEALSAYAPGRLLLKTIIDQSDPSGIRAIDRGIGDTDAKRDFSNKTHTMERGVWHLRTLAGCVIQGAYAARWRFGDLTRGFAIHPKPVSHA
jgi:CelD/BcsL family acetyltransferase involved in cellulose biosynthesis